MAEADTVCLTGLVDMFVGLECDGLSWLDGGGGWDEKVGCWPVKEECLDLDEFLEEGEWWEVEEELEELTRDEPLLVADLMTALSEFDLCIMGSPLPFWCACPLRAL